jgi:hypothetical protein
LCNVHAVFRNTYSVRVIPEKIFYNIEYNEDYNDLYDFVNAFGWAQSENNRILYIGPNMFNEQFLSDLSEARDGDGSIVNALIVSAFYTTNRIEYGENGPSEFITAEHNLSGDYPPLWDYFNTNTPLIQLLSPRGSYFHIASGIPTHYTIIYHLSNYGDIPTSWFWPF